MRNIVFLSFCTLICLVYASCYKEETIVPSASGGAERFTFPQGNASHDQKIMKVYDDFGVKIIYKNFVHNDFSMAWTTSGGTRRGYDIPEDQQASATGFLVDEIFGNLTPAVTKKVLPPYFYVADSIASFSLVPNLYETLNTVNYFYSGLDFWSFTWNGARGYTKYFSPASMTYSSAIITPPTTAFSVFYKRGVILKEILKSAINKGNIEMPDNFSTGFDFSTATINTTGSEDNVNFYKKRGFPGQMTTTLNFNFSALTLVSRTSTIQNFIDYVHLCMRYTPDSIEYHYPIAKNPLIHQKYPIVIKHLKDNYNIDLNKIATKPQF